MDRRHPMNLHVTTGPAGRRQTGAALFISLMFLIILTLIGVSAANVGILQERMAGNVRDSNIAFQRAEEALRVAELEALEYQRTGSAIVDVPFWPDFYAAEGLAPGDCSLGELSDADPRLEGLAWHTLNADQEIFIVDLGVANCQPANEDPGMPTTPSFLVLGKGRGDTDPTEVVLRSIFFWPNP